MPSTMHSSLLSRICTRFRSLSPTPCNSQFRAVRLVMWGSLTKDSGVIGCLSCVVLPPGLISRDLGIKVDSSWTYKASFYYRFPTSSSFYGTLTAGLRTNGGTVLAQATTQIRGTATGWTQINFDLRPTNSAPDNDNSFFISVDGAEAAGQTINFAMLSLFPPTFKDRPNGMRIDIAEVCSVCTRQKRRN